MRSLVFALAAVAAATVPAVAQEKVKPKAKPQKAKIALLQHDQPTTPPAQTGLIVPEPTLPPSITIVVPELQFADARPFPLGMVLVEAPRVTRIVRVAVIEEEVPPPDPLPWAFAGAGALALGAIAVGRRRGTLAHPLGSL